jgi:uroporphyrin-III C-methyltransferase
LNSLSSQNGFVYLVGAGPGDPELLTIKATKAIAKADVILIDDLVDEAALQYAQPTVRVRWVGKRGGCTSTPQAFIEKLMVHEAQAGNIVVRLKGGDPTIFGRLGEEVTALKQANIRFEIVSGISSGLAAASRGAISLTHRDHSHGVVFVTGHAKPNGDEANIAQLALAGFTVVIYMGVAKAKLIAEQLVRAGCSAELDCAIVQAVTTSNEKIIKCSLATLYSTLVEQSIASPALLLIGKVTEEIVEQGLAPIMADHEYISSSVNHLQALQAIR